MSSVTCTKGVDGKLYYFNNGKRVSPKKVDQPVMCVERRSPKALIRRPAKVAKAKKALPKEKSGVHYLWNTELVEVADGVILVPSYSIGVIKDHEMGKKNIEELYLKHTAYTRNGDPDEVYMPLVYVDAKTNQAFKRFQEVKDKFTTKEWNTWAVKTYPNFAKQMTVLKLAKTPQVEIRQAPKKVLASPIRPKASLTKGNLAVWTTEMGYLLSGDGGKVEIELPGEFVGYITSEQARDKRFVCDLYIHNKLRLREDNLEYLVYLDRNSSTYPRFNLYAQLYRDHGDELARDKKVFLHQQLLGAKQLWPDDCETLGFFF